MSNEFEIEENDNIDEIIDEDAYSDYDLEEDFDDEDKSIFEQDYEDDKELEEEELLNDDSDTDDKPFDNKFIEQIMDPYKDQNIASINDVEFYESMMYSEDKNTTTLYLTKYEKIRAIGERATMISKGALTTLDYKKLGIDIDILSPLDIAHLELKYKCMPFIIKRKLPNNKTPIFISINKLIDTIIDVNS
jgi:DNA-directed RNA polymerase subunit K/omega